MLSAGCRPADRSDAKHRDVLTPGDRADTHRPYPTLSCVPGPTSAPLCSIFVHSRDGGRVVNSREPFHSLGRKPSALGHWQVSVLTVTAES